MEPGAGADEKPTVLPDPNYSGENATVTEEEKKERQFSDFVDQVQEGAATQEPEFGDSLTNEIREQETSASSASSQPQNLSNEEE